MVTRATLPLAVADQQHSYARSRNIAFLGQIKVFSNNKHQNTKLLKKMITEKKQNHNVSHDRWAEIKLII